MSHFRGQLDGGRTSSAVKSGTKASGLITLAASWQGAIQVMLRHNVETGKDQYAITEKPHHGQGIGRILVDWTDFAAAKPNCCCKSS